MSRFVMLCFVIVLFSCYDVVFGSPAGLAEASMVNQQDAIGMYTPTEQHYLYSMISELLTKVVLDPYKELKAMMALYLEILGVASGSHIMVLPKAGLSSQEDIKLQQIAIASSNLWLKLPYAREMNFIYSNSSKFVLPDFLNNSSSEKVTIIIKELFKNIEKDILDNDSLAPLYTEERAKVEKLSILPLANGTGNPDRVYETNPRFRNFIIRRQLLQHLDDEVKVNSTTQFQRYALSQAVIQIAKTAKGSKMQEVFDQAVDITMDKLDPSANTTHPSVLIDRILFTALEEKFETIPELNDEFVQIKDDLFKKHKM